MQVIDTTPGQRAITLLPTEVLRSERLAAALHHTGQYTKAEAKELIAQLFDGLEVQLQAARTARAA